MDTAVEPVITTASVPAKPYVQPKDRTPMGRGGYPAKKVDYSKVGTIKAHRLGVYDEAGKGLRLVLFSRDTPQMVEILPWAKECDAAVAQLKAILIPNDGDLASLDKFYELRPLWTVTWKYARVDDTDRKVALTVSRHMTFLGQTLEQPILSDTDWCADLPHFTEPDKKDELPMTDTTTAAHWIKTDSERKSFWISANEALNTRKELAQSKPKDRQDVVHQLLEVEHIEEFAGTREDAITKLKEGLDNFYPLPVQPKSIDEQATEMWGKILPEFKQIRPDINDKTVATTMVLDVIGFDTMRAAVEQLGSDVYKLWTKEKDTLKDAPKFEQTKAASQFANTNNGNGHTAPQALPDTTTTALTTVPPQNVALTPEFARWEVMRQQAGVLIKSGFLPATIKSPEQAIAIMMMGEAIGVKSIVALNTINVINGKPTVSPQLMLAKARQSGQLEDFSVIDDGETCTVRIKRKGETEHVETFSQADAAAMGLAGKDNWKKQPATMRKWRAVAAACRLIFPDVLWGIASYTPEEINPDQMVNDAGEIVIEAA